MCFLDLSKAFDKVDHRLVVNKFMSIKVPGIITRILQAWYATQTFIVQWGSCSFAPFIVPNGDHEGGILSPYLFNVFIDDLRHVFQNTIYRCYVNGQWFNRVMYADDTLLLATSPTALQNLTDICSQYFTSYRLLINYKKSKCMTTCRKPLKDLYFPKLFAIGSLLTITNVEKETYLCFIMTSRDRW